MTRRTRGFLEGLILGYQKGRAVIAFGTLGLHSKDWERRRRLGSIDAGKNMATAMRRAG